MQAPSLPARVTLAEAEGELRSAALAFADALPTGNGFFHAYPVDAPKR